MRYAIAIVVSTAIGTCSAVANEVDDKQLHGVMLQKAVAGKTVHLTTPLGAFLSGFVSTAPCREGLGISPPTPAPRRTVDVGGWLSRNSASAGRRGLAARRTASPCASRARRCIGVRNDGMSGRAIVVR